MPSISLDLVLRVLSLLGSALTAYKLYHSGLYRRYPVFFAYFVFRVPNGAWTFFLDAHSGTYAWFWILTEPVLWMFYVWMVVELARLILEQYAGLYTVFRWGMIASVVVAASISVLSLIPRIKPTAAQRSKYLGLFLAGERGLDLSLAIFILLILLFLSRYPITLSRNVRVHAVVYSVYFLMNSSATLLHTVFGLTLGEEVNLLFSVISFGAMIAWLVLLTPAGEAIPQAANHVTPEHEQRLLNQLDSLNAVLLKSRK
jgi:hypothetical protein